MALTHIVVLAVSLLALLFPPCVVALVLCADEILGGLARNRVRRRQTRALRRLDRSLDNRHPGPAAPTGLARGPSIEQLAADLRRLERQRHGIATESTVWLAAVIRAYDDRLRLACHCLGIPEHLGALTGLDRDIERVRVEGALQAAGLALRSVAHRPPHRQP